MIEDNKILGRFFVMRNSDDFDMLKIYESLKSDWEYKVVKYKIPVGITREQYKRRRRWQRRWQWIRKKLWIGK